MADRAVSGRQLTDRGARRRDQLLTCATRLFAERGYHPTSVSDIVDELGVGKGVFYWYFKSKDQLFIEILRHGASSMREAQRLAAEGHPEPIDRIAAGIRATVAWSHEHRDLYLLFEFALNDADFRTVMHQGRARLVNDAARRLAEAMEAGQVHPADPELLARAILGVISHLTSFSLLERGDPPDGVAEAAVRFCLGGICAPEGRGGICAPEVTPASATPASTT